MFCPRMFVVHTFCEQIVGDTPIPYTSSGCSAFYQIFTRILWEKKATTATHLATSALVVSSRFDYLAFFLENDYYDFFFDYLTFFEIVIRLFDQMSFESAVCERLFARLVMGFGDDQENALQDYKSASTIMRFNNSLMKSSGLVPY